MIPHLTIGGVPIQFDDPAAQFVLADLRALNAMYTAIRELNTYADHTHSCKVCETGDHDDCDCGYNEAQKSAGLADSSSTSLPE